MSQEVQLKQFRIIKISVRVGLGKQGITDYTIQNNKIICKSWRGKSETTAELKGNKENIRR
jgi:hypothetical protein